MKKLLITLTVVLIIIGIYKYSTREKFKKVRFGPITVKRTSGTKIENYDPEWRKNMNTNRRIVTIEKLARNNGLLTPSQHLEFTSGSHGTHNLSINDFARKSGLTRSGELLGIF